jgi:hypothetical protein
LLGLLNLRQIGDPPAAVGLSAAFVDNGKSIVFTPSDEPFQAYIKDRSSPNGKAICQGFVLCSNGHNHVLVADPGSEHGAIDVSLSLLNVEEGTKVAIGKGNCLGFVSDEQVLVTHGFEHQGTLFNVTTGQSSPLDIPEGVVSAPRVCKDGSRAFLWNHEPSRQRFAVYEVDVDRNRLVEIFSVDDNRERQPVP